MIDIQQILNYLSETTRAFLNNPEELPKRRPIGTGYMPNFPTPDKIEEEVLRLAAIHDFISKPDNDLFYKFLSIYSNHEIYKIISSYEEMPSFHNISSLGLITENQRDSLTESNPQTFATSFKDGMKKTSKKAERSFLEYMLQRIVHKNCVGTIDESEVVLEYFAPQT